MWMRDRAAIQFCLSDDPMSGTVLTVNSLIPRPAGLP